MKRLKLFIATLLLLMIAVVIGCENVVAREGPTSEDASFTQVMANDINTQDSYAGPLLVIDVANDVQSDYIRIASDMMMVELNDLIAKESRFSASGAKSTECIETQLVDSNSNGTHDTKTQMNDVSAELWVMIIPNQGAMILNDAPVRDWVATSNESYYLTNCVLSERQLLLESYISIAVMNVRAACEINKGC